MVVMKALAQAHAYMAQCIEPGDTVVDGTMGNGFDTLKLAQLVGESGHVLAFDIQLDAINRTQVRLEEAGVAARCQLIHDGHEHMCRYLEVPVKLVLFNLGYLPGGSHNLFTRAETTITAIRCAMEHLCNDGMILVVVYHGGDSGYEERDALMEWFSRVDASAWRVQLQRMLNWPNDPPFLVSITRDR